MGVYKLVCRFKRKYPMTIANNLKKHSKVAASVIDPDEKAYYAFCGQKNDTHGMIFDTCVVVVTNKRLIIGQKRLLWGYQVTTITPELFNDLKISSEDYHSSAEEIKKVTIWQNFKLWIIIFFVAFIIIILILSIFF